MLLYQSLRKYQWNVSKKNCLNKIKIKKSKSSKTKKIFNNSILRSKNCNEE